MLLRTAVSLFAAALAAFPASAQRPGDPLSVRDPVPRPYEHAFAWYPYAPAAAEEDAGAGRAGLLFGSTGGTGFNLARGRALDTGLRPPASLPGSTEGSGGGAYVGYRLDRWTLLSGIRQGLEEPQSPRGTRLDLGASYGFNVNPRHLITLAGTVTLGQASTPALPLGAYSSDALSPHSFRAGEPGMGLRLSWTYTLHGNLFVDTSLGYDRLQAGGEALQGLERSTATFGTTFGYRW
jgi:hypothetical protein